MRSRELTAAVPAALTSRRPLCPFDLSVDFVGRMLNFEIADDPTYTGMEIQGFDDAVHGHGMAVLLTRRGDDRVDCYVQRGLRLDRSEYGIGGGLGRWLEAVITPDVFDITSQGVLLAIGLQDIDGRQITVRIDDRSRKRRRPATLLAPLGAAISNPDSLMLVWMPQFDLLRRTGSAPEIWIGGRRASTGRLPGGWLHRRHLIKYATDLAVVRLNARTRAVLDDESDAAATLRMDSSGSAVSALTAESGGHRARLELAPPLPGIDRLQPGARITGSWRLAIDAGDPVVAGTWTANHHASTVSLAMDVTQPWKPSHLPLLMRLVTTLAPVFRTWPTTYRWRASIDAGGGAVMTAAWLRSSPRRDDQYRRLTGTDRKGRSSMAPRRRIAMGIVDFLGGVPLFLSAPVYRHWHMRWGASDDEVRAAMCGDELVPKASFIATRAITIAAPPEKVWPWIVQMGYKRGGFYTYDIADNAGYPSATRVLPEYQHVAIGDWAFNMNSVFGIELPINEFDAFKVSAFEPSRRLLWEKPDSTWSWLLEAAPDDRTRLILRIRARPANLFWKLFMEFGDPPMARRMLKGIRQRAERSC